MRERLPDYDIVTSADEAPVVLAGPPRALRGRIDIRNPGDQTVVLRSLVFKGASGALTAEGMRHRLNTVVLRPTQGRTVPLKIAVDPATPPGEYTVDLELGGATRHAVLHVAEDFDLTVQPSEIVVENRPGEVQTKQLIVTNDGNVPFMVGEIGDIVLEDELIFCRAGRTAVVPWSDRPDARLEDLVVGIVKAALVESDRAGNMVVHNAAGDIEVAPGQTVTVPLEVTVPEGLHRNSRYIGVTPLFTADLVFNVVPSRGRPKPGPELAAAKRGPAKKKSSAKTTSAKKSASSRAAQKRQ